MNIIFTLHVLLGLLCERKGTAARVLRELGATHEVVTAEILRLLGLEIPASNGRTGSATRGRKVTSIAIEIRFPDGEMVREEFTSVVSATAFLFRQ